MCALISCNWRINLITVAFVPPLPIVVHARHTLCPHHNRNRISTKSPNSALGCLSRVLCALQPLYVCVNHSQDPRLSPVDPDCLGILLATRQSRGYLFFLARSESNQHETDALVGPAATACTIYCAAAILMPQLYEYLYPRTLQAIDA